MIKMTFLSLSIVYVNAHLYVYETLSKCEPGPVECKVSN